MNTDGFTQYGPGTKLFCDFWFGGKPDAVCLEVIEPGHGRNSGQGKIKVRLTETLGGYRKDEVLVLNAFEAVPKKQLIPLARGQFFTRLSTRYVWTQNPQKNLA